VKTGPRSPCTRGSSSSIYAPETRAPGDSIIATGADGEHLQSYSIAAPLACICTQAASLVNAGLPAQRGSKEELIAKVAAEIFFRGAELQGRAPRSGAERFPTKPWTGC